MPNKIAIDEGDDLVYVANEGAGDVTVIDGDLLLPITNITVGNTSMATVRDSYFCSIYIANLNSDNVSVISRYSNLPDLCLSSASIGFAPQAIGTSSGAQTVTLTNIGGATVFITSIGATGDFAAGGSCANAQLAPGQQCTIQVSFTPTNYGVRTGEIDITDNAANSPQVIRLGGAGTQPSIVRLTVTPVQPVYGQSITATATVVPASDLPPVVFPTGGVTFLVDGIQFDDQPLGAGGAVSVTDPLLISAGSQHQITALYHGDLDYGSSQSAPVSITIVQDGTFIAQAQSAFTADISVNPASPGSGTPTGRVLIQNNQNTVGVATLTNGAANINLAPFLPPGSQTVVFAYEGDANFLPSQSSPLTFTVPAPTLTTLTSSSPTAVYGTPVTLTATVSAKAAGAGNMYGTIVFRDGQTVIGSLQISGTASAASVTTPPITVFSVGLHSITAQYQDSSGDFLTSTSARLLETITAPSGVGGTPACACSQTGAYQAPASPVDASDDPLSSPSGKYTVVPSFNGNDIAISVQDASGKQLMSAGQAQALSWGFSPDDDRLVVETVVGLTPNQIGNIDVYDLTVCPQAPQNQNSCRDLLSTSTTAGGQAHVSFSPSGRYLLLNLLDTPTSGSVQIYQVQNVAKANPIYQANNYIFAPGVADDDEFGVETQGFSPDQPETSLVFAYATGAQNVQWNLVSLASNQKTLASAILAPVSDYWQYNPCGSILGLFQQLSQSQDQVTLYSTVTGQALNSGYIVDSLDVSLVCTATEEDAVVNGQSTKPASNTTCSNTPAGSNVTVLPQDANSGQGPVTVTFGSVTAPGTTTLVASSSGPAVPVNFRLGNPPVYFNLSTTAQFTPPAMVCVSYGGQDFTNPAAVTLQHFDTQTGSWQPISTPATNDPVHLIVCGDTTSFLPFAVMEPVNVAPPATSASVSPLPNAAGWNNSNVTVTFSVTDNLSGVLAVSQPVVVSTETPGEAVSGAATDFAGNTSTSTITVKLDKTPPEAVVQFNPATHDLAVQGVDALSGVNSGNVAPSSVVLLNDKVDVFERAELRTYKIYDLAGNLLVLTERVCAGQNGLSASVETLQYNNGAVVHVPFNRQLFAWVSNGSGSLFDLAQEAVAGEGGNATFVGAVYNAERDETIIKRKAAGVTTQVVKPGLVLVEIATEGGTLAIKY